MGGLYLKSGVLFAKMSDKVGRSPYGELFEKKKVYHQIPLWMTSKEPLSGIDGPNIKGFELRWHNDEALYKSMRALSADLEHVGIRGAYLAFEKVRPMAYKVDLWRYALLWKYGGVYMDHEVLLQKPLLDIIDFEQPLFACSDPILHDGIPNKLWNGLIACRAGSPTMLEAARLTIENIQNEVYDHFLDISGPGLLRLAVNNTLGDKFNAPCAKWGWGNGGLKMGKTIIANFSDTAKRSPYANMFFRRRVYRKKSNTALGSLI